MPTAESPTELFARVAHWAATTPEALFFDDGSQKITFAEGHDLSRRLAAHFRRRGLEPGQSVALSLPMGLHTIFLAACLHEGLASSTQPPRDQAGFTPDWLFTAAASNDDLAEHVVVVDKNFLTAVENESPEISVRGFATEDSLCRIAFSSGSTGTPKAVALSVAMVRARADAAYELWSPGRPFMSLLGLSTASGFHTFMAGLSVGDAYLPPGSAQHNAILVRTRGVAAIKASPVQISQLFEAARSEGVTLASLQTVYSAGSVVPLALRRLISTESSAQLINLYGSTEAGRAAERVVADENLTYAGDVVSGTELQIVDNAGDPVTHGTVGDVRYRRALQGEGYLGDPHATNSAFREGWFYTGDVGSLSAEGKLTLAGRSSSVINVGGVKVNPAEVEGYALTHPHIRAAAGFSHEELDGIGRFVLAIEADDAANLGELVTSLAARFGPLAPQAIFRMPTLPRNDMGKFQLAQIAEIYATSLGSGGR